MSTKRCTVAQFKEATDRDGLSVVSCRAADVVKAPDLERALTWTISDGEPDREGDTINPKGWDLKAFKAGGSVLWGHNRDQVIGKPLKTWVEGGSLLKSTVEFMPAEVNPFADMVFQMAKGRFVRSASVGFTPVEYSFNEERRGRFGPAVDFKKQELLEWSVLPVPANPRAVLDAKGLGIDVQPWVDWSDEAMQRDDLLFVPRDVIADARKELGLDASVSVPADLEPTEDKNEGEPGEGVEGEAEAPSNAPDAPASPKTLTLDEAKSAIDTYRNQVSQTLKTCTAALAESMAEARTATADVGLPLDEDLAVSLRALIDDLRALIGDDSDTIDIQEGHKDDEVDPDNIDLEALAKALRDTAGEA